MAGYREEVEEDEKKLAGPLVQIPKASLGSGGGAAPAPIQTHQQPGLAQQIGTGIAMKKGTKLAEEGVDQGIAMAKDQLAGPLASATPSVEALSTASAGADAALASEAAGLAAAEGAGASLGLGAAGAGVAAAAPWLAAGYLGGKAFGLFRHGTPSVPHNMQKFNPANPFGYAMGTTDASNFPNPNAPVYPSPHEWWKQKQKGYAMGTNEASNFPTPDTPVYQSPHDWWKHKGKGYAKGGIVSPLNMGKKTRNGGV